MNNPIAVQSWSFRHLTSLEELAAALHRCGISQLELSRAHFNAFDPGDTLARLAELGLQAHSAGVLRFTGNAAENRTFLAMARASGFTFLPADFDDTANLAEIAVMAREYGVTLSLHNHGRRHRYGSLRAMMGLLALDEKAFGVCLDTAWLLDAGDDPVEAVKRLAGRIQEVHLKDFVFDRAGHPADTVIGEGNLDLAALLKALRDIGFPGPLTIEYEGAPETVEQAVCRSLQYLA